MMAVIATGIVVLTLACIGVSFTIVACIAMMKVANMCMSCTSYK